MLEKSLKFILNKKSGIVVLNLSLVLLPAKVDSIPKKQGCKKNLVVVFDIGCIKIVLILLIEVIAQISIVQVKVFSF